MPQIFIGIGSNIDRRRNIESGVRALVEAYAALEISPVYAASAVGFTGAEFYNLVVSINSEDDVAAVHATLKRIETEHGRDHNAPKFSARRLDLDLLTYGDLVMHTDALTLPREDIIKYAFVLRPLAELAPEHRHPLTGEKFLSLWQRFARSTTSELHEVDDLELPASLDVTGS